MKKLGRATRLRKRVRGIIAAVFGFHLEIHTPPREHEVIVWIETVGSRGRYVAFHRMLWPRQKGEINHQVDEAIDTVLRQRPPQLEDRP